jgi:hypothetical protein
MASNNQIDITTTLKHKTIKTKNNNNNKNRK